MAEVGKVIDKPEASDYKKKKKIYFVRNLYLPKNATSEYKAIFDRYWHEVDEHLDKLEVAGKITKVFCESLYISGKEAMKVIGSMNAKLESIVQKKIDAGAQLLPLENKEIFSVYMDWYNCLMHVRTREVVDAIQKFLDDEIRKRFEYIKSVLGENIRDGEAGLLIMREEDRENLQLPDDVHVFVVSPPAYDDLLTFISNRDSGKEYWRT
jgi:DNA-binding ferritin-like protein (Dps family)